jgi:four helix bundle protein
MSREIPSSRSFSEASTILHALKRPVERGASTKGRAEMKLGIGDLDRDWEHPAVAAEIVPLSERKGKHVPSALAPISIEMISAIRPLVPKVRRRDRQLAGQLVRAASAVAMNIAEAEHANSEQKKVRYGAAAASANETQAALRVAVAWGYVEATDAEAPGTLIGRVNAMLWRLTRV